MRKQVPGRYQRPYQQPRAAAKKLSVPAAQRQQTVQNAPGIGRAAGHKDIHGRQAAASIQTPMTLRAFPEQAAGNGAGPHGHQQARLRHGGPRVQQSPTHVFRHRAGDHQAVGMARRGRKFDAETAQIIHQGAQHIAVGLAGVAAPGADLAQLEGAAEQAVIAGRARRRGCRSGHAGRQGRDAQSLPPEGGQTVLHAEVEGPFGAGRAAGAAKNTAAHVQQRGARAAGLTGWAGCSGGGRQQRACGAGRETGPAVAAIHIRKCGTPQIARRKRGLPPGIVQSAVFLVQAFLDDAQHGQASQIVAAI